MLQKGKVINRKQRAVAALTQHLQCVVGIIEIGKLPAATAVLNWMEHSNSSE